MLSASQTELLHTVSRAILQGELQTAPVEWDRLSPEDWDLLHRNRLLDSLAAPSTTADRTDSSSLRHHRKLVEAEYGRRAQKLRNFQSVFDAFEEAGVGYAVLKGPASSLLLHGDPVLRNFSDLDLLVEPPRAAEADAILRSHGYLQSILHDDDPSRVETPICLLPKSDLRVLSNYSNVSEVMPWVEVHCAPPNGDAARVMQILLGSRPISSGAFRARLPDLQLTFSILVADVLKDLRAGVGFRYRDFLEILLFARRLNECSPAVSALLTPDTLLCRPEELAELLRLVERLLDFPCDWSRLAPRRPDAELGRMFDTLQASAAGLSPVPSSRDEVRREINAGYIDARIASRAEKPEPSSAAPSAFRISSLLGSDVELNLINTAHQTTFECSVDTTLLEYLGWFGVEFRFWKRTSGEVGQVAYRIDYARDHVTVCSASAFSPGGRSRFCPDDTPAWLSSGADQTRFGVTLDRRLAPTWDRAAEERHLVFDVALRREIYRSRKFPGDRKIIKIGGLSNIIVGVSGENKI